MRKPQLMPHGSQDTLSLLLKSSKTKAAYRQILCLLLRIRTKVSPVEIDKMLLLDEGVLCDIQNAFTSRVSREDVAGILKMYSNKVRQIHDESLSKFNPKEIAEILGLKVGTVRQIQAGFIKARGKDAESVIDITSHGGDRRRYLSHDEEKRFLSPFIDKIKDSHVVAVADIKKYFEAIVGRKVATSTIYRLLKRHRWFDFTARSSGGIWMFQPGKALTTDGEK